MAAVDELLAYTGQVALTLTSRTDSFDVPLAGQADGLRGFPVPSVSSVSNAGQTPPATAWTNAPRAAAGTAGATWEQGSRPWSELQRGPRRRQPRAGHVRAATIVACARFNATRRWPAQRKWLATGTVDSHGLPASAVAMLSPFVRIFPPCHMTWTLSRKCRPGDPRRVRMTAGGETAQASRTGDRLRMVVQSPVLQDLAMRHGWTRRPVGPVASAEPCRTLSRPAAPGPQRPHSACSALLGWLPRRRSWWLYCAADGGRAACRAGA